MGIKSILCLFEGFQEELSAVNTALTLAATFEAQVRLLHISHEPASYGNLYDEGMFISLDMVSFIEDINKKRMDKARQHFTSLCKNHNIPLDQEKNPQHHAYAQFLHKIGSAATIITKEGRASDMLIIGRGIEPDILYDGVLIAALFNTGRPVLLLPSEHKNPAKQWNDKTISIAWDGKLESARAIFNALPFLKRAETINILTANDHNKNDNINFNKTITNYLSAHDIHPNFITISREKRSSGETILTKTKELGSDVLVMGAYGHSRLREIIMGGFTKYMLEKADIPLLLSH